MNARGVVVVLALYVFACSLPALSAADGWWGSFSDSKPASTAPAPKKSSTSSWWPWSSSKPKSTARSKPSTLSKMGKSTKGAWNKTVDFLNPFDDKPEAKPRPGSVPNTGNWFSSSKSAQEKPSSVPDWMAGEMPSF